MSWRVVLVALAAIAAVAPATPDAAGATRVGTTMAVPAAPQRAALSVDRWWSRYLKVPVVSFRRGEICNRYALGCVRGLRPPLYIRSDVLARAHAQYRQRKSAGRAGIADRRAAIEGINVILHEWAHAEWDIDDEAQADCWAGQWLWDFEARERFARAKAIRHQHYYWDMYDALIESGSEYGSDACYSDWSTAPSFFTGVERERFDHLGNPIPRRRFVDPEPPSPPTATPFGIARAHVSSTHFGPQLWTAGPVLQRVYLNLSYTTVSSSGHTVRVEWIRPDGRSWYAETFTIDPGYSGSSYWTEIGSATLAPMAGTWRVRFALDGGVQSGENTFNVERMGQPVVVSGAQFGASVTVQWRAAQELAANETVRLQVFTPRGFLYLDYLWPSPYLLLSGSWPLYLSSYLYGSGYWTIRVLVNGSVYWNAQAFVP
jgi:hypothetical protein